MMINIDIRHWKATTARRGIFARVCYALILLSTLQSFAVYNYAQQKKISIDLREVSVRTVFDAIEKQSEFYFTYNHTEIDVNRKVTVQQKNKKLTVVLDQLFESTNVGYTINDRHIILYSKTKKPVSSPSPSGSLNNFTSIKSVQQRIQITGVVRDENGQPVSGASVMVKGSSVGTVTDDKGFFSINADPGAVLVFSYTGYIDREVTVGSDPYITVVMKLASASLDEVVVVGYGTQSRSNVTAAISTIRAKDIPTTTSAGLGQSLAGKLPGLQVRQQNGEPGSFSSTINIRGFGEPLYVIDGIVRDGGVEFQQLNPNDIESITLLKDASAAIYGLNAANGVILVTTKKGASGKPVFNYTGVTGWQTPTNVPQMSTAAQYLELYDQAIYLRDGVHSISQEELQKWREGGEGYRSTNWYNETFKNSAFQQSHDFSIRGGNDRASYFVSMGYYGEDGLFKSGDMNYNRYNFRSNLTLKLTDNLSADIMLSGRYSKRAYPGGDGFIWTYKGSIISYPHEQPYINGDPQYPANIYNQQNPVLMAQDEFAGFTNNEYKNFQSSASLTYTAPFIKGLKAKATFAYDSDNNFNKFVWKNYTVYSPDLTPQIINPPRIANSIDDAGRRVFQGQIDYQNRFGTNHNVSATLVSEFRNYNKKYSYLKREYSFFTTDIVDFASGLQTNAGNERDEAHSSYIGRFDYDFKRKYMAGFSFRYDGSYAYTPEKRWGFFPAVSAGWRLSEEKFISNNFRFIDDLKLRGSFGKIGEAVGAPFQYVLGYTSSPGQGAEFQNGSYLGGMVAPGVINPNFTWVVSEIADVGIEGSLFNRLLSFEFDYYQRYKSGMLKQREGGIPNTFGGDMPIENITSEFTRGFDMILTHENNRNAFKYSISGNLNLARTMSRYTDRPEARSSYEKWTLRYDNRWNDFVWGYRHMGQFQNTEEIIQAPIHGDVRGNSQLLPGDYIYDDVNGDGIINNADMVPEFRNRTPKLFYGFTLTANWKNFDLYTVLQGASLYTMRFNEVFSLMFFNNGNVPAYFHDRWRLEDPYDPNSQWVPGRWPAARFSENMQSSYRESSIWRMNASYLRLKSVQLGYTLPSAITSRVKLDRVRIYANAHNLFTFADSFIKQFDPEKYEGDYQAGYNYPLTRSFNFGVNVSF